MTQLLPIIALGLIAWFWWGATRAREVAVRAASQACRNVGVQFLDQTVALRRMRIRRDPQGQLRWWRHYTFEFTTDGRARDKGYAITIGRNLADLHLDLVIDATAPETRH